MALFVSRAWRIGLVERHRIFYCNALYLSASMLVLPGCRSLVIGFLGPGVVASVVCDPGILKRAYEAHVNA